MKKILFKQDNIINIFFNAALISSISAMLGIIVYYIVAFASLYNGNTEFNWLVSIFSDFVEMMNASIEESPYIAEGASHPPLAIIILYPFALICKCVFERYSGQILTVNELTSKLIITPQFWIAILLFFSICTVSIIALIAKRYELGGIKLLKVSVIIITGAPFVYSIMRGNTIYFALIFLMVFMLFKDSENTFLRELSYISLAISGCLKIYPLFFGVFLLKDKKIFASLRVALYFFVIFFMSFFFFERDLHDIGEFTDNLGGFMSNESRLLGYNNLSISALLFKIMHLFIPNLTADRKSFICINLILVIAIFVMSTICAVVTKSDFSRAVICSSIVILIPSISYFYVLIFTVFPLMEYFNVMEAMPERKSKLYLGAFLFLYSLLLVLPKFFVPHSVIIILMLLFEIKGVIKNEMIGKWRQTVAL